MATQVLLIRPTHKKHKTNLITTTTTTTKTKKKKKTLEGPKVKCPAITQYIQPNLNKSKLEKTKPYKLYLKSQNPLCRIKMHTVVKK